MSRSARSEGTTTSRPRWVRWGLLLACFALLGSRSNCDSRPATLTCTPAQYTLAQGTCIPITNPCDASWQIQDALVLCGAPEGISISTSRIRGDVARELCVASGTASTPSLSVPYLYTQTDDFGEGSFDITVGDSTPLGVTASANPVSIQPGQASFLDAAVVGGTPPYSYAWSPAATLNDPTIANPAAVPVASTLYTVTVTDDFGAMASDSVDITVVSDVVVTASPSTIPFGFFSQLQASWPAAVPPIFYSWTPNDGTLSNPAIANPLAAPFVTTTYTVTIIDVNSSREGSVTLTVILDPLVSASPSQILPGGSSQLTATPRGGAPPYTFSWTSPDGGASLDDPSSATPIATPTVTTTYTVTVDDSAGQSVQRDVSVDVDTSGVLAACLSVLPDPPPASGSVTFDFSCSTGTITLFELWRVWSGNPAQPADYAGTLNSYTVSNELSGCHDARVRVTDDNGASDDAIVQICYQ